MAFIDFLFYGYYRFLKNNLPSYLGIEDTASSVIVATLFYIKIFIAYLFVAVFLIGHLLFDGDVFLVIYFLMLIGSYYTLVKKRKGKIIKKYKNKFDKNNFITLVILIYPVFIFMLLVVTMKIFF